MAATDILIRQKYFKPKNFSILLAINLLEQQTCI